MFEVNFKEFFYWYSQLAINNEILAFILTILTLIFILYTFYNQIKLFISDYKNTTKRKIFYISSILIFILSVILAIGVVKSIKYSSLPNPAIYGPSSIIKDDNIIRWEFDSTGIKKIAGKNTVSYLVQASPEKNFKNIIKEKRTYDSSIPINGNINKTLYWRVRAYRNTKKHKYMSVSKWSKPIKIDQYESSFERIKRTGVLRVAITKEYGRSSFRFFHGVNQRGIDPALSCELSKKLSSSFGKNIKLEFDYLSWKSVMPSVGEGRNDLAISAITNFPEREQKHRIKFSSPYHTTGYSLIYRPNIKNSGNIFSILKSNKVGVFKGTSSAKCMMLLNSQNKFGSELVEYDNYNQLVMDVMNKNQQVNLAVTDTPFAKAMLNENNNHITIKEFTKSDFNTGSDESCWEQKYSIAIRAEDKKLLTHINKYIAELSESGKLQSIKYVSEKLYADIANLNHDQANESHSQLCYTPNKE